MAFPELWGLDEPIWLDEPPDHAVKRTVTVQFVTSHDGIAPYVRLVDRKDGRVHAVNLRGIPESYDWLPKQFVEMDDYWDWTAAGKPQNWTGSRT